MGVGDKDSYLRVIFSRCKMDIGLLGISRLGTYDQTDTCDETISIH